MRRNKMTPPPIPETQIENVESNKKNKKWMDKLCWIIGAFVLLVFLSGLNQNRPEQASPKLKEEFNLTTTNLICEYGDSISKEDIENLFEYGESIPEDIVIDFEDEDPVEVYPVGSYTFKLRAEGYKTKKIHLMVEDTTAPDILSDTISIAKGDSEDIKNQIQVEDYSEYTVDIDMDEIDVNAPGNYTIIVKATDKYYNQTIKECNVTVEGDSSSSAQSNVMGGITGESKDVVLTSIPEYSGEAYIEINNNVPDFEEYEVQEATTSYETYSNLDSLGRCGTAEASISTDIMPTESRKSISSVKPSGWENKRYDSVPGGWLYNRCHLIGFQLTGENANSRNLITGTRYMNMEGMLPFENKVADYVKSTGRHVLYEVTPIYEEDNDLVASGVHMQACSVEDQCASLSFNIFAYNVQPGIEIDYSTGENWER